MTGPSAAIPAGLRAAAPSNRPSAQFCRCRRSFTLSEAVDPRYRALVLLATFTSLRWGELCALRRSDIDLDARTIRVERTLTELENGELSFGPPKSAAGRRVVGFPELVSPVVRWHLACFARPEDDGLVFTSPNGTALRRGNFRRRVWLPALCKTGAPAVHFMIFAILATHSRPRPAPTCAS